MFCQCADDSLRPSQQHDNSLFREQPCDIQTDRWLCREHDKGAHRDTAPAERGRGCADVSEVRCADGETICQARQQPGQCVLELQQILRDGVHRQPKHYYKEITIRTSRTSRTSSTSRMISTSRTQKESSKGQRGRDTFVHHAGSMYLSLCLG